VEILRGLKAGLVENEGLNLVDVELFEQAGEIAARL